MIPHRSWVNECRDTAWSHNHSDQAERLRRCLSKVAREPELHLESPCWSVRYCSYRYALLAAHCSRESVSNRFKGQRDSNTSGFFISTECSSAETLLRWRVSAWDDAVSKVAPEPLSGCDGGRSTIIPELELHLESSFLTALWVGELSTMTPEPELHLEWSFSTALSRSCAFA
jgi:hypothetical protein